MFDVLETVAIAVATVLETYILGAWMLAGQTGRSRHWIPAETVIKHLGSHYGRLIRGISLNGCHSGIDRARYERAHAHVDSGIICIYEMPTAKSLEWILAHEIAHLAMPWGCFHDEKWQHEIARMGYPEEGMRYRHRGFIDMERTPNESRDWRIRALAWRLIVVWVIGDLSRPLKEVWELRRRVKYAW